MWNHSLKFEISAVLLMVLWGSWKHKILLRELTQFIRNTCTVAIVRWLLFYPKMIEHLPCGRYLANCGPMMVNRVPAQPDHRLGGNTGITELCGAGMGSLTSSSKAWTSGSTPTGTRAGGCLGAGGRGQEEDGAVTPVCLAEAPAERRWPAAHGNGSL